MIIIIQGSKGLYWMAGPVLASPCFMLAIVSYILCKKGHKKLAWLMPLAALVITGLIMAGI